VTFYRGRALRSERPVRRRGFFGRLVRALGVIVGLVALAHLPWGALRRQVGRVQDVKVEGLHYLDAARVCAIAGIRPGVDLIAFDRVQARQALLLSPRILRAEVDRVLPRGVRIRIVEREPVLLVQHGTPWEVDSSGVLLPPLAEGSVADVPLLSGPRFDGMRAGAQIRTPEVQRGLAWVAALSQDELQLGGQVSQIGVSDPNATELQMMNGTRVLTPPWPPGVRELSALRVVLADLQHRGMSAEVVDLRFHDQVIVKPSKTAAAGKAAEAHSG
jgi:cell division septal protein FtsQ